MFYFLIYLILLINALLYFNTTVAERNYKNSILLALLIFILVAGLRYEIGVDYFNYQFHFNNSDPINKLLSANSTFLQNIFSGWEPGCIILFSFLKTFFNDAQIVFFVASVICSILLFKSFKHFVEPQYIFFSLLIYFCFVYMYQEMHALRQALGACVFYYGITKYPVKKQVLLYTFLAGCFHYSLWLFLPLIIFINKPINIKIQIICIIVGFLIFLLRIPWMSECIIRLGSMFPEFGLVLRLVGYTDGNEFSRPFFFTFIFYIIPYLLLLFERYREEVIKDEKMLIAYNLYFLYLVFTMYFWEFSFFSIRYGWICMFGMAVVLPQMIKLFKQPIFPILYIMFFCYIPIRTFMFPDVTTSQFTPYENYVSRVVFGKRGTGRERAERFLKEHGSDKSLKE